MRADVGASVALYAARGVPLWDAGRYRALLEGREAELDGAVFVALEGADGEVVALLAVDGLEQLFDDCGLSRGTRLLRLVLRLEPRVGDVYAHEHRAAVFYRRDVVVDDLVALREEGFAYGVFHVMLRVLYRDEVDEVEEG